MKILLGLMSFLGFANGMLYYLSGSWGLFQSVEFDHADAVLSTNPGFVVLNFDDQGPLTFRRAFGMLENMIAGGAFVIASVGLWSPDRRYALVYLFILCTYTSWALVGFAVDYAHCEGRLPISTWCIMSMLVAWAVLSVRVLRRLGKA